MHLVHWFEIPVNDIDRARVFYEAVFEVELKPLQITEVSMLIFPMKKSDPGTTGALTYGGSTSPSQDGPIIYFSVSDIQATINRIENAGGEILLERTTIDESGSFAHFEDSEGNRVGLHAVA